MYHVYKNCNKVSSFLLCLTFILYMLRIVALDTTQRNVGLQIAGTCSWSFFIKYMYNSYARLALSLCICRVHNWMNSIKIWIVCCMVNNTTYFWVIFLCDTDRLTDRRISYTFPPPIFLKLDLGVTWGPHFAHCWSRLLLKVEFYISQRTHTVSSMKSSRLMLFMENVAT
jgi:hypothetical protein